jgi:hypothetical protein
VFPAKESVVRRLLGEHDANDAVRADLANEDVGVVVEMDVGAEATRAVGDSHELRRNGDPGSFSLREPLCED